MKIARTLCLVGLLALAPVCFTLTSCSTGTSPGDTNVEHGDAKEKDHNTVGGEKQGEGHRDNESGADR